MRWYWPITCDNTVDDPLVTNTYDFGAVDPEGWVFLNGEPIRNWDPSSWVQASSLEYDGMPDDVLQNHLGILIYSARLRAALDGAGIGGIQYLPLRVLHADGSPVEGYAIANILNLVAALDWENTRYELFGPDRPDRAGQIRVLYAHKLRRSALEGYDIIRLEEYEQRHYVSERFEHVFTAGAFTGYSFRAIALS